MIMFYRRDLLFNWRISINIEVKVRVHCRHIGAMSHPARDFDRRTLREAMLKKRPSLGRLEHVVDREYQPLRVAASTSNRVPS